MDIFVCKKKNKIKGWAASFYKPLLSVPLDGCPPAACARTHGGGSPGFPCLFLDGLAVSELPGSDSRVV